LRVGGKLNRRQQPRIGQPDDPEREIKDVLKMRQFAAALVLSRDLRAAEAAVGPPGGAE